MNSVVRNRFDLICSNSLQNIVLERVICDTGIVNIRFSIALGNGVVTLHDDSVKGMITKLTNISLNLHHWVHTPGWFESDVTEDRSELYKIAPNDTKSIATMSLMRTGTNRVKLTFTDCTKSCSEIISDTGYPCYELKYNANTILANIGLACVKSIDILENK